MKTASVRGSEQSRIVKGVLLMLCAAFSYAMMSIMVRMAGPLPTMQKVFFRNVVSMIIAFSVMYRKRIPLKTPVPGNGKWLFVRSLLGFLGVMGNYYAIDRMLVSDATVIAKLSPFVTLIVSAVLLGEVIRLPQIFFIALAFLGAVLVSKPQFDFAAMLPVLGALTAAVCGGSAYACVRGMIRKGEDSNRIIFWFSVFSCIASAAGTIREFRPMTASQALSIFMVGIFACGGQFFTTSAYRFASAGEIAAADYSQIFMAAVLGFLFFRQIPDRYSVLGYLIIIGAVLCNTAYNAEYAGKGNAGT